MQSSGKLQTGLPFGNRHGSMLPPVAPWTDTSSIYSPRRISGYTSNLDSSEEPMPFMKKSLSSSIEQRTNSESELIPSDVHKASDIEIMDADNDDEDDFQRDSSDQGIKDGEEKGLEKLFQDRAVNGFISIDELPALLMTACVDKTQEEIRNMIDKLLCQGDGTIDKVEYDEVLNIFQRLMLDEEDTQSCVEEEDLGCLSRWTANLSDARATNTLLAIVVIVSAISAFLAAGLAVLFMWNVSSVMISDHLKEDLGTVRDIVDVFEQTIFVKEINSRVLDLSTIISSVVNLVSYKSTLEYNLKNLQYTVQFLSEAVAAWWVFMPEKGYTDMARVMALWLQAVIWSEGRQNAYVMVNSIQHVLPPGFEILMGEWTDDTNTSIRYLTEFRFRDQCKGACDSDADVAAFSPMKAAMTGIDGAVKGLDYRPHEVLVGYTSIEGVGVEYKSDLDLDTNAKYTRMTNFFNTQNLNAQTSHELLLGRLDSNGNPVLLTKLRKCDDSCTKFVTRSDGPLGLALQRKSGTMEVMGYDGKAVLAAYAPIPGTSLGLVMQMSKQECVDIILQDAVNLVDWINANFSVGTEELELTVMQTVNGTDQFRHLSKHKFANQCPNGICLSTTPYLEKSKQDCSQGVMRTTDYRGKRVIAGYYCLEELNTFISMKMDEDEMHGELLKNIVAFINNRNTGDRTSSDEFFIAQAKDGVANDNITSSKQFDVLTVLKHPENCINADCTWDAKMLLRAIHNKPGDLPRTMSGVNYAGASVTGALDFDAAVGGGIAMSMEMDTSQYMRKILQTTAYVLYFTLAMTVAATVVLIAVTKHMMRSMIAASDEGKRAIEKERQQFSDFVGTMYPAYVVPRLLTGERHIVSHVRHTAVFFSDIYEFTSASNTISPEELVQFMGYTYGVMDDIASRYGVYKVKTIGDAYLAITGLPGVAGATVEGRDCCLDMLRFASCVAQVFSHRFSHPEKGKILSVISGTMSWNRRRKRVQLPSTGKANKNSVAPPSSVADSRLTAWAGKGEVETESSIHPASTTSGNTKAKSASTATRIVKKGVPQMQCVMSYGISTGSVTAGVLQGKSPMFDIWGKTVNLASRLETTSEPGRIQVSEQFFRKVVAVPNQPFQFEEGHKTFCKGFGVVNSYYVCSSTENPPKDLMVSLGIEPCFGPFYFDNVLSGTYRNHNNNLPKPNAPANHGTATEDSRSEMSHTSSQKTNPKVVNNNMPGITDGLDFEDY